MHAFNDVLAWLASMFHALTGKLIRKHPTVPPVTS
jgi:hypothetical protein